MTDKKEKQTELIPISNGNKWGYCDTEKNIIIPFIYDNCRLFSEDLAAVKKDGYWGYVDREGTFQIDPRYSSATDFEDRRCTVASRNSHYKFILDASGNILQHLQRDDVDSEGFTLHKSIQGKNDRESFRYYRKDGGKSLPGKESRSYDTAKPFKDGIALVNGNTFIDENGNEVFSKSLKSALQFSEGLAAVVFPDKYGFVDQEQNIIVPFEYSRIGKNYMDKGFSDGMIYAEKEGKKYFLNDKGKIAFEMEYDDWREYNDGMCAVKKGNKWGFIDVTGIEIISPQYSKVKDFSEGFAFVGQSNKWAVIDKTGKQLSSFIYYNIWEKEWPLLSSYSNRLLKFSKGTTIVGSTEILHKDDWNDVQTVFVKLGLLGSNGTLITDIVYSSIGEFCCGYALVSKTQISPNPKYDKIKHSYKNMFIKKTLWGYIDEKGNEVLDLEYEQAKDFQHDLATVKKNGLWGVIDKNGKTVINFEHKKIQMLSSNLFMSLNQDVPAFRTYKLLNSDGEEPLSFPIKSISDFKEGIAKITVEEQLDLKHRIERVGYLNDKGKIVVEPIYLQGEEFSDGRILAEKQKDNSYSGDKEWVYLDGQGNIVLANEYQSATSFKDGFAIVRTFTPKGTKSYYIDKNGNNKFDLYFDNDYELNSFHNGYALVKRKLSIEKFYLDKDGKKHTNFDEYDKQEHGVMAQACKGYIDKKGNEYPLPEFSEVNSFSEGYAVVQKGDGYCFINKSFQTTFPNLNTKLSNRLIISSFEGALPFSDGFAAVKINDKWGFINLNGELAIEPIYIYPHESFKNGLAKVGVYKEIEKESPSDVASQPWLRKTEKFYISKTGVEYRIKTNIVQTDFQELNKIRRLFIVNPRFFIDLISKHYPFTEAELQQYKNILNWKYLSQNTSLDYSYSLIRKFKDHWFWFDLTQNPNIDWHRDLIRDNLGNLNRPRNVLGNPFLNLSSAHNVAWNKKLIAEFSKCWDWKTLSGNNSLPWNVDLVIAFREKWDWEILCVKGKFWSEEVASLLLNELQHHPDKSISIACNKNIEWSEDYVDSNLHHYLKSAFRSKPCIYNNHKFKWDINFIIKYSEYFDWNWLSNSKAVLWSGALIDKFIDKWDWHCLSSNESIEWDNTLINKYSDKIVFSDSSHWRGCLSGNKSVKWDKELLIKYEDKIDFKLLCANTKVLWDEKMVAQYEEKLDWKTISSNPSTLWSTEMLTRFRDKIDWSTQSIYTKFNWDYQSIEKLKSYINWHMFSAHNNNWSDKTITEFFLHYDWNYIVKNKSFPWNTKTLHLLINSTNEDEHRDYFICNIDSDLLPSIDSYEILFNAIPNIILNELGKSTYTKSYKKHMSSKLIDSIMKSISSKKYDKPESENYVIEGIEEINEMHAQEVAMENNMSNSELADLLGYDDDDVDDISQDDIWERTGH